MCYNVYICIYIYVDVCLLYWSLSNSVYSAPCVRCDWNEFFWLFSYTFLRLNLHNSFDFYFSNRRKSTKLKCLIEQSQYVPNCGGNFIFRRRRRRKKTWIFTRAMCTQTRLNSGIIYWKSILLWLCHSVAMSSSLTFTHTHKTHITHTPNSHASVHVRCECEKDPAHTVRIYFCCAVTFYASFLHAQRVHSFCSLLFPNILHALEVYEKSKTVHEWEHPTAMRMFRCIRCRCTFLRN